MTPGAHETTSRPDAPSSLSRSFTRRSCSAQTIARERLFERLRDGRGRRLSLVACPAGFGKSTLLAAWRESEAHRRPVAWVTLDEGDNDAVVLWSHVIEALCRACPGLAHETLAALAAPRRCSRSCCRGWSTRSPSSPTWRWCSTTSTGSRARRRARASRGSSSTCRRRSSWCSRPAPIRALPLGTLRARGQLLELRADELRFTVAEADEFLNERLELGLAAADVELLVARTEGWPAGIYLAALSLVGHARTSTRW